MVHNENETLTKLLNDVLVLLNNDYINLIVKNLEKQEFNFKELVIELDIKNENIDSSDLVRRVIIIHISQELLKIQSILNMVFDKDSDYDVFLSHCSWDASEILGLKLLLEYKYRLSTYVDWIDDRHLNFPRSIEKVVDVIKDIKRGKNELETIEKFLLKTLKKVKGMNKKSEKHISEIIISKLKRSNSVFYVQSRNYDFSRWMPWELGIAEASGKKIYRLPIKYIRTRKKHGKRSGFLVLYKSIINQSETINENELKKIVKKRI